MERDYSPGDCYTVLRPTLSGFKKYKLHILAVIDDKMVVFKYYGKHKQWWHYEMKHREFLDIEIDRSRPCEGCNKHLGDLDIDGDILNFRDFNGKYLCHDCEDALCFSLEH